jgi:DNA-binding MarR family transcriptional regulator
MTDKVRNEPFPKKKRDVSLAPHGPEPIDSSSLAKELIYIASQLEKIPASPITPDTFGFSVKQFIDEIKRVRLLRAKFFPEDLFADPAWDMLLELKQAEINQLKVPVSNLCSASGVPATTALRWIAILADRRMIIRKPDPLDGRRVFVSLHPETSELLERYFESAIQRRHVSGGKQKELQILQRTGRFPKLR